MAKKIGHVVLLGSLLISAFYGTCVANWDDLTRDLKNINRQVNEQTEAILRNVNHQVHQATAQANFAIQQAEETIKNLPRDEHGRVISNTFSTIGNTMIINNGHGQSKSIVSGYTKEGEPFVRQVDERNDDGVLYHYETYFKPKSNTTVKTCWKLDHTTPGAVPEILNCSNEA